MRIGIIHSIYKPDYRGGAETVVENIVAGLKAKGEDVFVIAVGRKNKMEEVSGTKIYRVKPFNLFNFLDINEKPVGLRFFWHILDMFNKVQAWRVFRILKKEKPDLIFTHSLKGLGYYLPFAIRILKIKNIHTIHDCQLVHPSGLMPASGRLSAPAKIYCWFCKKLFGSPAVVVFPSEFIKSIYERHGFFPKSKKIVLGNPMVIKSSKPKVQSSNMVNFLFLGQVEEYKGIFELIEAIKGVAGEIGVIVVGEGKALPEAKIMAQDDPRIEFYGRLNSEELENKIWPQIDVLVNPSKTMESFGMVVIEAFAHGVPALVSNIGALPELVREGETGFIIQDNGWQEKIQWCLANKDQLAKMRPACLQEAEKYDLENYLNKLMEFSKIG